MRSGAKNKFLYFLNVIGQSAYGKTPNKLAILFLGDVASVSVSHAQDWCLI